jgi:hypothetical protein
MEEKMKVRILAFAVVTAAMITSANAQQAADDHLGTVHFPISCSAVQGKFDRAVALLHSFFYPETVKAFQAIIKEDPDCAMAYWGLAMSELPNPLVPPFPPANLKAGSEAIQQGKAAKTQTPGEAEYLAAIEVFYTGYEKIDHKSRAEHYEQAMQRLHEHYPEDSEAAIFYALALNGAVDFDDKNYTKQLKAAAILNEEAKRQPNHPGIAHYLIHSYDFAPLAAMCETAPMAMSVHQTGHQQLLPSPMISAPGYLAAISAKGPVCLTVPSMITTAPAGITPDAPRRGSVIAYAPRMMMVSVMSLHPCKSARLQAQTRQL